MIEKYKNIILSVLIIIQVFKSVKYIPQVIKIIILLSGSLATLTALGFSFVFYGSLPETRRTALTYWMRHFLMMIMIGQQKYYWCTQNAKYFPHQSLKIFTFCVKLSYSIFFLLGHFPIVKLI
jgi:hypothetical protein